MIRLAEAPEAEIKNRADKTVELLEETVAKLQSGRMSGADVAAHEADAVKAPIRATPEGVRLTQGASTRRESGLRENRRPLSETQLDLETAQRRFSSYNSRLPKETTALLRILA